MGQDINTNKANISIGQANNHIEVDPEARATLLKKIGGSSIGWDTETDGLGGAEDGA